ncbi:hypothetical protein MKW98_005384 [Papaver atlanticum]|uniref:Glycine-rich protein n=1 Tax=Papaver atlanticum TaxID=357466 RepID=A0AAD4X527_9MAGN|nr:hypothetical protein MKW98_005384 [Papaver atlanticum]
MGLLARTSLCFLLLIHLSLSSGSYYAIGSVYEQQNENNVQGSGMMVRINRRLGRGGGGSRGGGRSPSSNGGGTASRRVPYTGGIYAAGAGSHNNNNHGSSSAPLIICNRNSIGLLASFIVAIILAAEL